MPGVQPAVKIALGVGLPAAVDDLALGHVPKRAWLQQIKYRDALTGKHDQGGLHFTAKHFDAISRFAGLFFIDGPDHLAGGGVKFIAFENDFVKAVFLVGHPFEKKCPHVVDHRIEAGRSLVGEQHGARSRLVGKQFAVPQKFGSADDGGKSIARVNIRRQVDRLGQVADHGAYCGTLLAGIGCIHLFRCVERRAPHRPGIMGGHKADPVIAGQGGNLSAQGRVIEKIALPGALAAGTQRVFEYTGKFRGFFKLRDAGAQSLVKAAVSGHTVDPGTEGIHPAVIKGSEAVPVAGKMQGHGRDQIIGFDLPAKIPGAVDIGQFKPGIG